MTCSEGVQGEPPFAFAKAMSPKSAKKRPGKLDEVRRAMIHGLDARRAAQAVRDACRSGNQDRVLVAHRVCSAGFGRVSCRLAPCLIWKRFPSFQEVMRCRPVTCLLGIMWIRESPDCVMEPAASVTQGGRRTGATAAPGTLAATRRECVMPVGQRARTVPADTGDPDLAPGGGVKCTAKRASSWIPAWKTQEFRQCPSVFEWAKPGGKGPFMFSRTGLAPFLPVLTVALSGLWLSLFFAPAGHATLTLTTFRVVASLVLASFLALGLHAAASRRFTRHGNWMVRAWSLALGTTTQGLLMMAWESAFGTVPDLMHAILFAAGWLLTLAFAELCLVNRRRQGGQANGMADARAT
ncbi:MAG: DUF2306 domain-containing protein [Boseongicola sp. SB0673_bin_14]|nr:DUF2306 domain-containing protein [Boseongicola sp. SB0673_bin_14]